MHRLSRIHRVIPAKAGISVWPGARCSRGNRDSRLRGNDAEGGRRRRTPNPLFPHAKQELVPAASGGRIISAMPPQMVRSRRTVGEGGWGRGIVPWRAQAWTTGPTGSFTPSRASPGRCFLIREAAQYGEAAGPNHPLPVGGTNVPSLPTTGHERLPADATHKSRAVRVAPDEFLCPDAFNAISI